MSAIRTALNQQLAGLRSLPKEILIAHLIHSQLLTVIACYPRRMVGGPLGHGATEITSSFSQGLQFTSAAAMRGWALSAQQTPNPYILIDPSDDQEEFENCEDWLRAQPVPVLACARPGQISRVLAACDVVVTEPRDLKQVIANIEKAPLAAAILAQVLRMSEPLGAMDALILESLAYATLQSGPEFARWLVGREKPPAKPVENGPPLLLQREGGTLGLTLNRPLNRNAISVEMRDALVEALELGSADETIAKVTIRGNGACFSVGGDLAEFGLAPSPAEAHNIRMQRLPARALLRVADRTEVRLHGACIGAGIELPAFAKRVTAAPRSFFQLPEIQFGLIPGAGGCASLPKRIGRQRTAYLALSARRISADTALDWGLIDSIEPS